MRPATEYFHRLKILDPDMSGHRRRYRRLKALLLSPILWRKRLLFWFGAVIIGAIAACFAVVSDYTQRLFGVMLGVSEFLPLIVSPALFALTAYLALRWFPSTPGSGIPQAIAARKLHGNKEAQKWLLGPQVIPGKILLTLLVLLGGASIGREGPTVQVGAAILMAGASMSGLRAQRGIILAGAAAGVAAAFNTPLAGIVFGIEELARGFHHRNTGIVLMAIVFSGAATLSILGNYDYFGYADAPFTFAQSWTAIIATGVIGGLAGGLFSRMVVNGGHALRGLRGQAGARHPVIFAAICGLAIAGLGLATHGATYGTGYTIAKSLLHGQQTVSWTYCVAKFLATVISGFSGTPGGIFSPSLSIGAALGSSLAPWFAHTAPNTTILLAMTSFFAGVTQAPITAFIIVLEITGKGIMPAPLIAAAVIATASARIISPVSIYHALAKDFEDLALKATSRPADDPEPADVKELSTNIRYRRPENA